jgi:hypothetical protein
VARVAAAILGGGGDDETTYLAAPLRARLKCAGWDAKFEFYAFILASYAFSDFFLFTIPRIIRTRAKTFDVQTRANLSA